MKKNRFNAELIELSIRHRELAKVSLDTVKTLPTPTNENVGYDHIPIKELLLELERFKPYPACTKHNKMGMIFIPSDHYVDTVQFFSDEDDLKSSIGSFNLINGEYESAYFLHEFNNHQRDIIKQTYQSRCTSYLVECYSSIDSGLHLTVDEFKKQLESLGLDNTNWEDDYINWWTIDPCKNRMNGLPKYPSLVYDHTNLQLV